MNIGYYVNPIGLTTHFGIKMSHVILNDVSSMSRGTSFSVTYFRSKSVKSIFLIIYRLKAVNNKENRLRLILIQNESRQKGW
jgi:hypothetical protein